MLPRLISALKYNALGLAMNKGALFVAMVLVARVLGSNEYGRASIVVNTTSMVASVAALSLGLVATRYIAQYRTSDRSKCGRILGLSSIIGLVSSFLFAGILFALSEPIAANQLGSHEMALYLQIGAVAVVFTTYNGIQRGVLTGFEAFDDLMRIDALAGVVGAVSQVVGAIYWGVGGYIAALALTSSLTNLFYWLAARKVQERFRIRYDFKHAFREKSILLGFALPSTLSSLMVSPIMWLCGLIVISSPGGYSTYGVFSAAFQWRSMLTMILSIFGNAVLPMLVSSRDENPDLERANVHVEWVASLIISAFVLALSYPIASIYGSQYYTDDFALCLAAIATSCMITGFLDGLNRKMIQHEKVWLAFLVNAVWGLSIVAFAFLLQGLGGVGLSYALLISYLIMLIFACFVVVHLKIVDNSFIFNSRTVSVWCLVVAFHAVVVVCPSLIVRLVAAIVFIVSSICVLQFHKLIKGEGRSERKTTSLFSDEDLRSKSD